MNTNREAINQGSIKLFDFAFPCTFGSAVSINDVPYEWRSIKNMAVAQERSGKLVKASGEFSIHIYPKTTVIFWTVYEADQEPQKFSVRVPSEYYKAKGVSHTVLISLAGLSDWFIQIPRPFMGDVQR